ncbi:hypothetical protein VPH35_090079 [Triticum aestivum]
MPRAALQGDTHLLQHEPLQGVRAEAVPQAPVPRGPRVLARVAGGGRRRREEGRRLRPRRAEDKGRRWVGAAAVDPEFQLITLKLKLWLGFTQFMERLFSPVSYFQLCTFCCC